MEEAITNIVEGAVKEDHGLVNLVVIVSVLDCLGKSPEGHYLHGCPYRNVIKPAIVNPVAFELGDERFFRSFQFTDNEFVRWNNSPIRWGQSIRILAQILFVGTVYISLAVRERRPGGYFNLL